MSRKAFFKYGLIICLIIVVSLYFAKTPKQVLLSFDVEEVNTPEQVNFILEELSAVNASATFFVQGNFALENPDLIKKISKKYEISSHTMTHPRLQKINESQVKWELTESKKVLMNMTNKTIKGFRAPYNGLNKETMTLIKNNYEYDASMFKGYSWFFPPIPNGLKEVPISTMLFIPMEDVIFTYYLKMGDFGYFLMSNKRKETISIDFHPQHIWEHKLAFKYLLEKYNSQGAKFMSHEEYLGIK